MFEEFLPDKRIGYIYPRWESDSLPYELYHCLPDRVMVVVCPVGLREFTPEDVERALAPIDSYIKALVDREVDVIVHGGVPLDLLQGVEKHDALIEKIRKKSGLPTTSTIMTVIDAAKHLAIKKVAFVNKWNAQMNRSMMPFFERAGIQVVGTHTRGTQMADILKMKINDNTTLLYQLAREAFQKFPEVDGLYIGGGSMIAFPIVDPLEKEFGKPVIIHGGSLSWNLCHLMGCWTPMQGKGRLLASP